MVTPYIVSATSMVFLLCVIITNCVRSATFRSIARKRPMFASSSGASTSSRMQKGLGFTR